MDEMQKEQLWEQFKALEAKAISMNHYDLARNTAINDVQLWKQFLTDPEVSAYIDQESQLLAQTELRKLTSNVADSRSVGQAQLINAMGKVAETKATKEGPIFIYTYVPLANSQMKADNVKLLDKDVFEEIIKEDEPEQIVTEEPQITQTMSINNNNDDENYF